ncbi:MAG: hypothetical protein A2600_07345 [Candidatus Lambdaproteobacteria bacterium RIFOXYD1_FULL_56_27]|uniref:BAX inhibitor protein n=1 Tax=Candidatus Lambdaproteobacteria bacterium RIFOXYD2_FULL_56_26 TaxID=1817773 RepID=A0A1F6GVL0_9PROT|nr:MAG: hypothetical protein A2557_05400 [Candidatus Lambdaproteobacteria bacterium RIFOXYD2_FULL_56_26]OGH03775.1 MAG: hypothetical protein A2426_00795 [Candidatus Lambdaproteobacteria bacterium RIFOXYC1_FULL_56_13]OGH07359.1 MAG: hypothetical protein A2600_07345 [Candidatus Lambdaproteobacteria bacterium RIFOXYD1_FULL_56_27]
MAPTSERMAFLRKIYGLLALSTFMAAGAAFMTVSNEAFLATVAQNQMLFFALEIGAIFFTFWARKKETLGLVALFSFTTLTGVTIAPVLLIYTGASVVNAALMTGIVFVGLSVYTVASKKDFTFMGGMLTTGLIVLVVGGLLNLFFFHSSGTSFLFSAFGAMLFSGFIVFDTFNILNRYPTDEYISATLTLYLDVLNLFLSLLRLFGGNRD